MAGCRFRKRYEVSFVQGFDPDSKVHDRACYLDCFNGASMSVLVHIVCGIEAVMVLTFDISEIATPV